MNYFGEESDPLALTTTPEEELPIAPCPPGCTCSDCQPATLPMRGTHATFDRSREALAHLLGRLEVVLSIDAARPLSREELLAAVRSMHLFAEMSLAK